MLITENRVKFLDGSSKSQRFDASQGLNPSFVRPRTHVSRYLSATFPLRIKKIPVHASRIYGERIQKYLDSLPNSSDACGRKQYSERK